MQRSMLQQRPKGLPCSRKRIDFTDELWLGEAKSKEIGWRNEVEGESAGQEGWN